MQQHHVGAFGMDLVEPGPDQAVVVEVLPAGHGHFRPGREKHLLNVLYPGSCDRSLARRAAGPMLLP
jgi:hypothetical protein